VTECCSARQPCKQKRVASPESANHENRLTHNGPPAPTNPNPHHLDYSHDAYRTGVSYGTKRSE